MARSIKVLNVDMNDKGDLVAGIEVTKTDGSVYERTWTVPAKDVEAITTSSDITTAVQTYIAEMWPATPTWAADLVGKTIDL